MPQGISVHIGLNFVDPRHYEGWDGQLTACEADAKDMQALAKRQKFSSRTLLLTRAATAPAVSDAILGAAKALKSGDLFFLTYSGHGGQVDDTNSEEKDRMDETWVCYDRQLIDDELYEWWGKFKASVRILVLSDSCHSGTVTRKIPDLVRSVETGSEVEGLTDPGSCPRLVHDLKCLGFKAFQKRRKRQQSGSFGKGNRCRLCNIPSTKGDSLKPLQIEHKCTDG